MPYERPNSFPKVPGLYFGVEEAWYQGLWDPPECFTACEPGLVTRSAGDFRHRGDVCEAIECGRRADGQGVPEGSLRHRFHGRPGRRCRALLVVPSISVCLSERKEEQNEHRDAKDRCAARRQPGGPVVADDDDHRHQRHHRSSCTAWNGPPKLEEGERPESHLSLGLCARPLEAYAAAPTRAVPNTGSKVAAVMNQLPRGSMPSARPRNMKVRAGRVDENPGGPSNDQQDGNEWHGQGRFRLGAPGRSLVTTRKGFSR